MLGSQTNMTSSEPNVTSPEPNVTSSAPNVTSLAPNVTSSAPDIQLLRRANASLKPDKQLLNSKFEQYKYTSGREHSILYKKLGGTPYRVVPPDSDYSYQMTRSCCLHNHLITNPEGTQRFYMTVQLVNGEEILCLRGLNPDSISEIEFYDFGPLVFNISSSWLNHTDMFLCIGDCLHLIDTDPTDDPYDVPRPITREYMLQHQSLLLYSFHDDATDYVVLCHREQDNAFVHSIMKAKKPTEAQIKKYKQEHETPECELELVSSLTLSGIARFVSVRDNLLTLLCEGKYLNQEVEHIPEPVESVKVPSSPVKQPEEDKNSYTWVQSSEDVEVTISLPKGIVKSDLKIDMGLDTLEVRTKGGQELFKEKLFSKIEPSESTWCMSEDKKKVEVTLTKYQEAHNWAALLDSPSFDKSGNLLGQISDLNEAELQAMVRRMGSLNEYTSDTLDASPLYTPSRDLEECDELDGHQVLLAGFDLNNGVLQQRYLVELTPGALLFTDRDAGFVISHSVDACFYSVSASPASPWSHSATFHAFNMVQATKTQKKFVVTDSDRRYVAIVDTNRHIYIYSSSSDSPTGKLLLMTLDNDDSEVLGVHALRHSILLLTQKNLITVQFTL